MMIAVLFLAIVSVGVSLLVCFWLGLLRPLAVYPLAVLIFVLALAGLAHAAEPKLPPGYTCQDVKDKVAQYGKVAAWIWAVANLTKEQRVAAQKCLR